MKKSILAIVLVVVLMLSSVATVFAGEPTGATCPVCGIGNCLAECAGYISAEYREVPSHEYFDIYTLEYETCDRVAIDYYTLYTCDYCSRYDYAFPHIHILQHWAYNCPDFPEENYDSSCPWN